MNVLITSASRKVGLVRAFQDAPSPEFAVRVALGQLLAPRIGDFTNDLVMLRYTEDRFIAGSALDAMGGTS